MYSSVISCLACGEQVFMGVTQPAAYLVWIWQMTALACWGNAFKALVCFEQKKKKKIRVGLEMFTDGTKVFKRGLVRTQWGCWGGLRPVTNCSIGWCPEAPAGQGCRSCRRIDWQKIQCISLVLAILDPDSQGELACSLRQKDCMRQNWKEWVGWGFVCSVWQGINPTEVYRHGCIVLGTVPCLVWGWHVFLFSLGSAWGWDGFLGFFMQRTLCINHWWDIKVQALGLCLQLLLHFPFCNSRCYARLCSTFIILSWLHECSNDVS